MPPSAAPALSAEAVTTARPQDAQAAVDTAHAHGGRSLRRRGVPRLLPAAFGVLALVALGGLAVPVGTLTRDIAAVARVPPYTGVLSTLGILLWCVTAAICLFAARVADPGRIMARRFLASAGAITVYLTLDDQFQLHETVLPRLLGIGEFAIVAVLGLVVGVHLLRFARLIASGDWRWLAAALVLLGCSATGDVLISPWTTHAWSYFVEDGLKWLGIVCWARHHIGVAAAALRPDRPDFA